MSKSYYHFYYVLIAKKQETHYNRHLTNIEFKLSIPSGLLLLFLAAIPSVAPSFCCRLLMLLPLLRLPSSVAPSSAAAAAVE